MDTPVQVRLTLCFNKTLGWQLSLRLFTSNGMTQMNQKTHSIQWGNQQIENSENCILSL